MVSVSVVIPAYNSARYLPASIASVLAQTFSDFELLVVDDGSTDDTRTLVARYQEDSRVKYIPQANKGSAAARNTGIRLASSALVAFLDADDVWLPRKLELQWQAMRDRRYGACYGAARYVFPGNVTRIMPDRERQPAELYRDLLFKNVMYGAGSSMIVRRDCFDTVGLFDERLVAGEDRDLWLRLTCEYRIRYLDDELIRVDRTRSDAKTKNRVLKAEGTVGLMANLESSIPGEFLSLMPQVRQKNLLRVSGLYLAGGHRQKAGHYALKALTARPALDRHAIKALKLVVKSLLPRRGAAPRTNHWRAA